MNKKENAKYMDVPIIKKGKIYKNESKDGKNGKLLTATLVIIIVILLMFCGYSMAKIIGEVIIRGQAQIAEPILVIENIFSSKFNFCFVLFSNSLLVISTE